MKRLLTFAAALLVSGGASIVDAQWVAPAHLFPVVAKLAGAQGTDWMTNLFISNLSSEAATVTGIFLRENTNNTLFGNLVIHEVTLQGGQTLTVPDVLGSWFPGEGNTKGVLLLLADPQGGGGEDMLLAASARIFNNANPSATYGQAISSSFVHFIIGRGKSVLTGARHDGTVRSNVGIVNLSLQPLQVIITTYNAAGVQVAQVTKQVESFSLRQWALSGVGVSSLAPGGRVEVQIDPDTITWDCCSQNPADFLNTQFGLFMAYISRIDQVTGDAEFALGLTDWEEYVDECGEVPDQCP